MLRTSLGKHPSIIAKTEMFNPDWTKNATYHQHYTPETTILKAHIYCAYPTAIQAVGFVLHRSGARFGDWPDLWDRLEQDRELHIINLRRNNLLRRYLSYRTMREPKTDPPTPKIINIEELRKEFEQREQELASFNQRFAQHPMITLSYEDLCYSYKASMRQLQVFLGVPYTPLVPATKKRASQSLTAAIENFAELKEAFVSTRWEWFFQTNTLSGGIQINLQEQI